MAENVTSKQILEPYYENLSTVVNKFAEKSFVLETDDEKEIFIIGTKNFLKKFRTLNIHVLISALIEKWESWDNYSIAVVYFSFLKNLDITNVHLTKYRSLLKKILLSTPDMSRLHPKDTINEIIELSRITENSVSYVTG